MKSHEFMDRLEKALTDLPEAERTAALGFYSEYFADAADEERAVIKLGNPESVAQTILADYREQNAGALNNQPAQPTVAEAAPKKKNGDSNRILLIIILALLSPLWLPAALGVAAVGFTLAVGILAVVFSVFIGLLAIGVGALVFGFAIGVSGVVAACLGVAALINLTVADGLFILGSGLAMTGLGVIITVAMCWVVVKATPVLVNWFVDLCKLPFRNRNGKGAKA